MLVFFKVFFINLVSDIDNMLILGTILREYSYLKLTFPAVIVLTFTRTVYIVLINGLSNVPMLHLLMGIILFFIAFKLVRRSTREEYLRPSNYSPKLKAKALLILAATDFLICLDSVIIISGISQNVKAITLGIFFSLLISLLFLPLIVRLAVNYFWINIIAGGFIAQHAVVGILNDPMVSNWIYTINKSLPEANIVNIVANGTIIIFVVIGLYSYIKHHRIYR